MRHPNEEQFKAIAHTGGVSLSAGAGSGKTFVLIEHIIYLIEQFIAENSTLPSEQFRESLQVELSGIVLMTFTKKAAGELYLRVSKRVKSITLERPENDKWNIVGEYIGQLNINTIHGFCFSILRNGLISEDFDSKIISDIEYRQRIEDIFIHWLDQFDDKSNRYYKIILYHWDEYLKAVSKIFASPELRKKWSNESDNLKFNMKGFIVEIAHLLDFYNLITSKINLETYFESADKKWFLLIKQFNELSLDKKEYDLNMLLAIDHFFKENRMSSPKKGTDEIVQFFLMLKRFKSFAKDSMESLINFMENKNIYLEWNDIFHNLVRFTAKEYCKSTGMTFSDIEYNLEKSFDVTESLAAVQDVYRYFIVDEFQDTSLVQFSIIKKLIGDNFNHLFVVGDKKQAIYGFRGGELSVFSNCDSHISKCLNLDNNYRSYPNVIKFNNNLFSFLLNKGFDYEGKDHFAVAFDSQLAPLPGYPSEGEIRECNVIIDIEDKAQLKRYDSSVISRLEAEYILFLINQIKNDSPGEQICVLYSKLGPSVILIEKLIESKISFTSQIKLESSDDPVIDIFKLMIGALVEKKRKSKLNNLKIKKVLNLLEGYLALLGFNKTINESHITLFFKDCSLIGPYLAYEKFLFQCSFANSNNVNNIEIIKSICDLSGGDIEEILELLEKNISYKYNVDLEVGSNNVEVVIMTVHASKGLEFPHVILGGVHTNGRYIGDSEIVGSTPGSIKWKKNLTEVNYYKSPQYLLEKLLVKHKDFSETKRLFYVACTRAQKSLSWVKIESRFGLLNKYDNSWIVGLDKFFQDSGYYKSISKKVVEIEDIFAKDDELLTGNKKSFFYLDNLGISEKNIISKTDNVFVLPELSVTRLSSLINCPRKFYLQNICKINTDLIDLNPHEFDYKTLKEDLVYDEENISFKSSAQRGTLVHENLSQYIISKFDTKLKTMSELGWSYQLLDKLSDRYKLLSEQSVKFLLGNYMISGIPDLVLQPNKINDQFEIWDFKTGLPSEEKELPYWFQLTCYGCWLFQNYSLPKNSEILIKLIYVDKKLVKTKKIKFKDIEYAISNLDSLLFNMDKTNEAHCGVCTYNNLCQISPL